MMGVAASKWTPPALPRDLVPRPALRRVLDAGVEQAVTLVCAPPGFGKSLLLAEWVKRCPEIPAAWVSLEEEDEDPRLLWNVVLAALRECPAVPPSSGLHRLVASRTSVDRDFVEDLIAALAALQQPLRLVLDDVHHLRAGPVQEDLRMLVRGRVPGVHLVLASRMDPALPLARLRLDGELCELRADQLRFSTRETAVLFEKGGVRLDRRHRDVLHARTGGWVAGLRLAERSMRDHPDPDGFIEAFSGDERSVSDYLVGEVLAGITDAQREVLRRTSVADPVPATLAVELCDREDAADILDALCRDLGLVTATGAGRGDYRIQELLRSHVLWDLRRSGEPCVAALHRRAALWWDRRGCPAQALRHAGQAGDRALVTELLRRRAGALVARGEFAPLRAASTALGDEPGASAWRAASAACLDLERGDRRGVAEWIRRARGVEAAAPDPDLAALVTAIERLAGLDARPPGAEPELQDQSQWALVLAGRGVARVASGSLAAGRADLRAALDSAHRLGLPFLEMQCLCALGAIEWADGDLREAAEAAAAAAAAVRDGGWDGTGWAACAHAVAALAALERGRPHEALDAAAAGLRTGPAGLDPVLGFALHTVHGGALFDRGEKAAGLLELQQALADVTEHIVPPPLAAMSALLEHRIALRLGYAAAAAGATSWLAARPGTRAERLLMRAWVESTAGSYRAARDTIDPLLRPSARPAWPATAVEAWLVVANAALEDGDRVAARQALRAALDRAGPPDVIRPFTLASSAVRALLVDELVSADDRGRFAARVLAAPQPGVVPAAVVLTAREHDVLARLPSLLNLDEIADDLTVSVNTVKSHVRSIYDKLGAGTRRTAVLAAHERGLLRRVGPNG